MNEGALFFLIKKDLIWMARMTLRSIGIISVKMKELFQSVKAMEIF